VPRKTKICNLESATIVDEQVGCLHISMEDVVVVEVSQTLEQLQHVAFDLRFLKLDVWVVEESREIVIHVGGDHVENRAFPTLSLRSFYCHLFQLEDIVVREHLQQLDFSQRCDRKAIFLIVHQNLLEREDIARDSVSRFVHLTKSSLTELLHHLVLANL
jgi:hypothetical protein